MIAPPPVALVWGARKADSVLSRDVARLERVRAAGRSRQTALGKRYRRLCQRRGRKRAGIAVGHTILVTAYHLLTSGQAYREPAPRDTQAQDRERLERNLVRRLEALGNTVTIMPSAA